MATDYKKWDKMVFSDSEDEDPQQRKQNNQYHAENDELQILDDQDKELKSSMLQRNQEMRRKQQGGMGDGLNLGLPTSGMMGDGLNPNLSSSSSSSGGGGDPFSSDFKQARSGPARVTTVKGGSRITFGGNADGSYTVEKMGGNTGAGNGEKKLKKGTPNKSWYHPDNQNGKATSAAAFSSSSSSANKATATSSKDSSSAGGKTGGTGGNARNSNDMEIEEIEDVEDELREDDGLREEAGMALKMKREKMKREEEVEKGRKLREKWTENGGMVPARPALFPSYLWSQTKEDVTVRIDLEGFYQEFLLKESAESSPKQSTESFLLKDSAESESPKLPQASTTSPPKAPTTASPPKDITEFVLRAAHLDVRLADEVDPLTDEQKAELQTMTPTLQKVRMAGWLKESERVVLKVGVQSKVVDSKAVHSNQNAAKKDSNQNAAGAAAESNEKESNQKFQNVQIPTEFMLEFPYPVEVPGIAGDDAAERNKEYEGDLSDDEQTRTDWELEAIKAKVWANVWAGISSGETASENVTGEDGVVMSPKKNVPAEPVDSSKSSFPQDSEKKLLRVTWKKKQIVDGCRIWWASCFKGEGHPEVDTTKFKGRKAKEVEETKKIGEILSGFKPKKMKKMEVPGVDGEEDGEAEGMEGEGSDGEEE